MARILIKNGRIWDGERFLTADLLTEGKKIAKIQENITDVADYIYDASGKTVSAGLVDLHVHMKGFASEKYGIEPHMSSFPFGVTAVNDAGSEHGSKALLEALWVKNTVFVGSRIKDDHVDLSFSEERLNKYGDRAIGIKVYFDRTITEVQSITPLKELCAYAKAKGLKVMVHCSHSPTSMAEIIHTLSAGDILTHIYHGGENSCVENDFEAFKIARQKGIVLDSGFAGNVHTNFENFKNATKTGFLPDTISTDITCCSAYKRGGRYGMTLCMSMAKAAGMTEEKIFKAVTSAPAKALGKEWGALKEGECADIAVFDYTDEGFDLSDSAGNRIHSDKGYRCILTVVDGQILYKY